MKNYRKYVITCPPFMGALEDLGISGEILSLIFRDGLALITADPSEAKIDKKYMVDEFPMPKKPPLFLC